MRDVCVQKVEGEAAVAFAFLLCKKDVQLQGRSKTEKSAEDVDYCLLLLVEVQPPKEVEDAELLVDRFRANFV